MTSLSCIGTVWNDERVPMSAGAVLLWDDGRKASFHCSFDRVLMQSMEVAGTQGIVYVDDWVIPYKVLVMFHSHGGVTAFHCTGA